MDGFEVEGWDGSVVFAALCACADVWESRSPATPLNVQSNVYVSLVTARLASYRLSSTAISSRQALASLAPRTKRYPYGEQGRLAEPNPSGRYINEVRRLFPPHTRPSPPPSV